jgi:uncharacterized membrane protein
MAGFLVTAAVVLGKTGSLGATSRQGLLVIVLSGATWWLFYFLALRDGPATGVAALDRLGVCSSSSSPSSS